MEESFARHEDEIPVSEKSVSFLPCVQKAACPTIRLIGGNSDGPKNHVFRVASRTLLGDALVLR